MLARRLVPALALLYFLAGGLLAARAQTADISINWEVKNRFRLFADEKDFDRQVAAYGTPGAGSILASERRLAADTEGLGWARDIGALCFDASSGRLREPCRRDGVNENYINPASHRVALSAVLPPSMGNASCVWTFGEGSAAKLVEQPCAQPVEFRFPSKAPTQVSLTARPESGEPKSTSTTISVRDVLIVGMGDSIGSGEGNPDRPVGLDVGGFCFRRFLSTDRSDFFLPTRSGDGFAHTCPTGSPPDQRAAWQKAQARWLYAQCHRSLYSHQTRTALALAIENPQLAVTYVPLSCSGATIAVGLLGSQPARERPTLPNGQPAPRDVEAQFGQLDSYLGAKGGRTPFRRPDLILLTIGANDIGFSALVANVLVSPSQERSLLQRAGMITDIASADKILEGSLAGDFRKLRSRLHGFTGGSLDRVVYTVYGNPGEKAEGAACPGGRRGYDAHPAFAVDGGVLAQTVGFVEDKMIPRLRAYVECGTNGGCAKPAASDAMNFVDGHRQAFAQHGYCAADASVDPAFDSDCFKDGGSFRTDHTALDDPMTCARRATEFRTYASRARWVRTANDSYFAAMTYPASLPWFLQALDIHDAIWGISGVVYGGALHPTAEGHAAMADAAIIAARKVLGITAR